MYTCQVSRMRSENLDLTPTHAFRAEKRSAQASAHPLSQAQGGLFCVDCVERVREFCLRLNEMHTVWTFAPRKAFLLLCGFCFSWLENYFGLGTTSVKGKPDHSVSLRWNKEFWTFPKRRVFFDCSFDLFVSWFRLLSPGWIKTHFFFKLVNTFSHAQIYSLCRTNFILLFSQRTILCAVKLSRKYR